MEGFPHEMLFDVSGVRREVPDVAPLTVGDRTDRVSRAFGIVVVHAVGEVAVLVGLAAEDLGETSPVEFLRVRFAAGEVKECGENVGVLYESARTFFGRNFAGPAGDQ